MEMTIKQFEEKRGNLNPLKFALWISLASISMLFAGFMSAYMVRQAAGNWFEFTLPWHFTASTMIIVISSVIAHITLEQFKRGNEGAYKIFLILTFVLGLAFVILQYLGWQAMMQAGIDFKANPSGAFVYVISGVHVAHVLAGLAAWCVALVHGFGLPFKPTKKRIGRLELTAQYWHYVDLLWVVLFLFLTYYR
ncbi:MAG: cytochrome c oxidase subunit 3 [Saprospiraceae bacterium]|nr:cytochrome c oxidase subunit 3 [Saprospiraceae bacterium]